MSLWDLLQSELTLSASLAGDLKWTFSLRSPVMLVSPVRATLMHTDCACPAVNIYQMRFKAPLWLLERIFEIARVRDVQTQRILVSSISQLQPGVPAFHWLKSLLNPLSLVLIYGTHQSWFVFSFSFFLYCIFLSFHRFFLTWSTLYLCKILEEAWLMWNTVLYFTK